MNNIITKVKKYILKKQIIFMIDHENIYNFIRYLFRPDIVLIYIIKKILLLFLYKILEFLYNKKSKENINTFFTISRINLCELYKFEPFGFKTRYHLFIINKKIEYFIKTDRKLDEIIKLLKSSYHEDINLFISEVLYVPYISCINGPLLLCLLLLILDYTIDNLLKAFIISLIIKLVL